MLSYMAVIKYNKTKTIVYDFYLTVLYLLRCCFNYISIHSNFPCEMTVHSWEIFWQFMKCFITSKLKKCHISCNIINYCDNSNANYINVFLIHMSHNFFYKNWVHFLCKSVIIYQYHSNALICYLVQ